MERSFIVAKESEYYKDREKYITILERQRQFIKKFFTENNLESTEFHIGGDGMCNVPFYEDSKEDIRLYINPTENDLIKFGKMLTKQGKNGLCAFKKNSSIGRKFAQRCIDEQIVINLLSLDMRDYFQSLGWNGYHQERFVHNDNLYLKIESDYLKDDDTPEGFIEIKLSEYHKAREEFESKEVV